MQCSTSLTYLDEKQGQGFTGGEENNEAGGK